MWAVSQQRIMIHLHGRQSKGKRNGHDLSTMEKGGGEPFLSLMHPLHFLHAQNPFQQVSFQTLAIKAILTWK